MAVDKHSWSRKERKENDRALRGEKNRTVIEEQVLGEKGTHGGTQKKVHKPFLVEARWSGRLNGEPDLWTVWGRYPTRERRDQALEQLQKNRAGWMTYRAAER